MNIQKSTIFETVLKNTVHTSKMSSILVWNYDNAVGQFHAELDMGGKTHIFAYRLANIQTKQNKACSKRCIRNYVHCKETVSNIRKIKVVYKIMMSQILCKNGNVTSVTHPSSLNLQISCGRWSFR